MVGRRCNADTVSEKFGGDKNAGRVGGQYTRREITHRSIGAHAPACSCAIVVAAQTAADNHPYPQPCMPVKMITCRHLALHTHNQTTRFNQ